MSLEPRQGEVSMSKCRKQDRSRRQRCAMLFLTLLVAASARAQTPVTALATDDRSDATSSSPFLFGFAPLFMPLGLRLLPDRCRGTNINQSLIKEFDKAWRASGGGIYGREGVVLIFRMKDGSFKGELLGLTNEYKRFTFTWNPAALAIVHTH